MNLDLDTALKLANFAIAFSAIAFTWFATRKKDTDRRLDTGSKRMDQHDLEIQALKQTVASLPAKEDMHRLELTMSDIGGEIKAIAAHIGAQRDVMRRLETVVTRHEDHLLDKGKGK